MGHRSSLKYDEYFSVKAAMLVDCGYLCRGSRLEGNVLVRRYVGCSQRNRSMSKIAHLIRINLIPNFHDTIAHHSRRQASISEQSPHKGQHIFTIESMSSTP